MLQNVDELFRLKDNKQNNNKEKNKINLRVVKFTCG
jgi:hypothetical protein